MSSLNSDLTVSNGDRWYESGEPSEQTAEGETQEGEKKREAGESGDLKELGSNAPSQPGGMC